MQRQPSEQPSGERGMREQVIQTPLHHDPMDRIKSTESYRVIDAKMVDGFSLSPTISLPRCALSHAPLCAASYSRRLWPFLIPALRRLCRLWPRCAVSHLCRLWH